MNRKYTISIVDKFYVLKNKEMIKKILAISFKNSDFNPGYSINSPFDETLDSAQNSSSTGIKFLIALNENQEIVGGVMDVETIPDNSNLDANCGWLFTISSLSMRLRTKIAIDLVHTTFRLSREGGFKRIVTKMGTKS